MTLLNLKDHLKHNSKEKIVGDLIPINRNGYLRISLCKSYLLFEILLQKLNGFWNFSPSLANIKSSITTQEKVVRYVQN